VEVVELEELEVVAPAPLVLEASCPVPLEHASRRHGTPARRVVRSFIIARTLSPTLRVDDCYDLTFRARTAASFEPLED
jgi:hypothetical protein